MVHPINPNEPPSSVYGSKTPDERQKMFELQFQTAVISDFVAFNEQNGSLKQQLSKLKNGMAAGQPPDQLASDLNQLITQVNQTLSPGLAPFPAFMFSTGGGQVEALSHFALSLQKLTHVAAAKGKMERAKQEGLFNELNSLINIMGQLTAEAAYNNLNQLIHEVNKALPPQYGLPKIKD